MAPFSLLYPYHVELALRMELFLNLAWVALAALMFCLWLRYASRTGPDRHIENRKAQFVALAVLLLILFPVISVTDDLQAIQNPAETDTSLRRGHLVSNQHSIFPTVAALPLPVFAELSYGLPSFQRPAICRLQPSIILPWLPFKTVPLQRLDRRAILPASSIATFFFVSAVQITAQRLCMKRSFPFLVAHTIAALIFVAPASLAAQQSLTWDQVKAKFEACEPSLESGCGQRGGDEGRGDHGLSSSQSAVHVFGGRHADRAPQWSLGSPFRARLKQPNFSYLHERDHKRELRLQSAKEGTQISDPSIVTLNAIWSSACARPLCRHSRPRPCFDWPRPTSNTTTRSSTSAAPASTPATWPKSTSTASSCCACNTNLNSNRHRQPAHRQDSASAAA